MIVRLGKIQKFALAWSIRRNSKAVVSKSGILLTYSRRILRSRALRQPKSVKSVLTPKEYNRLHVSFTRALQRLAKNGLVELHSRGEVFADQKLIENVTGAFGRKGGVGRREVFYSVTENGLRIAKRLQPEMESLGRTPFSKGHSLLLEYSKPRDSPRS